MLSVAASDDAKRAIQIPIEERFVCFDTAHSTPAEKEVLQ
jgi:hypothetical protein